MSLRAVTRACLLGFFWTVLVFLNGCATHDNHITLVDLPSGRVAGVATEVGVLMLNKSVVNVGDLYPIEHPFRDGVVTDEAKAVDSNESLALLKPVSARLYNARFLLYPLEPGEELYVGILDSDNDTVYLDAELVFDGAKGDLILCSDLEQYPEPSPDGYGGIGLFAYRDGGLWLTGILTPMTAVIDGVQGKVYPFINMDQIFRFLPELKDFVTPERRPFRPDFEHGVNRDGSGE